MLGNNCSWHRLGCDGYGPDMDAAGHTVDMSWAGYELSR